MPRLGVFVLSNYFAVIYVPVYSVLSRMAKIRGCLGCSIGFQPVFIHTIERFLASNAVAVPVCPGGTTRKYWCLEFDLVPEGRSD